MPRAAALRRLGAALVAAALTCAGAGGAGAADALIAVATNFRGALERIAPEFEADSGHSLTVAVGATGKLYAQIVNGAPFDVFLAADQERPERLEADGLAVPGSRFTYAVGRLALWSADPAPVEERLRRGDARRLAIANPDLAPYGRAARQTLERLGLAQDYAGRIAIGQSVGQAHAMVASGAADMGFVALAQVVGAGGGLWIVPEALHDPIRQDAALLTRAADNPAAVAFLAYLKSDEARARIAALGYAGP